MFLRINYQSESEDDRLYLLRLLAGGGDALLRGGGEGEFDPLETDPLLVLLLNRGGVRERDLLLGGLLDMRNGEYRRRRGGLRRLAGRG